MRNLTTEDLEKDLPKLEEISLTLIRWALTLQNGEEFGFKRFTPGALTAIAEEKEQAARNVDVNSDIIGLLLDPSTPEEKLRQIKKGPFGLLMECLWALRFDFCIEFFADRSISAATKIPIGDLELLDQYRAKVMERYAFDHLTRSANHARSYKRTAGLYLQ